MKQFIRVMKALSDPSRVKILKLLQRRELCVCELTAALGLAQPTVSNHLKALEDAGLVESAKQGQWVNYSLARPEDEYARVMLGQLETWLQDDPGIKVLLATLEGLSRENICQPRQLKKVC